MGALQDRIGPPETQRIVLALPWELWIRIRDWGRVHNRTASGEIRSAIEDWCSHWEFEQHWTAEHDEQT